MKNISGELENAFNKSLNIIKNDLYYQQLEIIRDNMQKFVRVDIFYRPLEILSGDSYSVRKTEDGKVVFFLIDAMGKGISASVTATSSTTLLNYIFDQMQSAKNFDFQQWIKSYIDYIKSDLLDNEMLSVFFGCYDKHEGTLHYSSFGMPSFLLYTETKEFTKTKSNNMPISKYLEEFKIDLMNIKDMKKTLFYSDGLCEGVMSDGTFYKERMYQDFIESNSIVEFTKKVKEHLPIEDDDISFLYIDTRIYGDEFICKTLQANREDLDGFLYEISDYVKQAGAKIKEISELSLALSELLANALEHGTFGISNRKKHFLIEKGTFDETITDLEKEHLNKNIDIRYCIKNEGDSRVFILRIEDRGNGFDVNMLKHLVVNPQSFNGRGIMIVKKLVDRIYYNEKGNSITIRKYLN